MEEVLEAAILAGEVRISVAVETSEAEVPALAALDTSAVVFCILVREPSAFHHPERVNLKCDPMLSSCLTVESRLNQRPPQ